MLDDSVTLAALRRRCCSSLLTQTNRLQPARSHSMQAMPQRYSYLCASYHLFHDWPVHYFSTAKRMVKYS